MRSISMPSTDIDFRRTAAGRRRGTTKRRRRFRPRRFESLEARRVLDSTVVFNEIMYHPDDVDQSLEWIELHNQMAVDMDLSGWRIEGGVDFEFAADTIVPGGAYLVVAASPAVLEAASGYADALGPFDGRLANGGESLELVSHNDRVMDAVDFGDSSPWPVAPDGSGASLAKADPNTGSAEPANWTTSAELSGTPGESNFSAPGIVQPTEGLIAFYDFDGNTEDTSGNLLHGVPVGATPTTGGGGFEGEAYTFNGSTDYVSAPVDVNPTQYPQLTFGAWVRSDVTSGSHAIISHDDGGWDRTISVGNDIGASSGWSAFAGGHQFAGSGVAVDTTKWAFVAAAFDQTTSSMTLYVDDDVSTTEAVQAFTDNATDFGTSALPTNIGRLPSNLWYFDGLIDNVFFVADALDATEIQTLRDGGAAAVLDLATGGNNGGGDQETPTLAINEISPGGDPAFQVELVNHGDAPIELEGLILASSVSGLPEYVMPAATLPAGGYLTVDAATLGFTAFNGDRLFLYTADRAAVVDAAEVDSRLVGRSPEGTGQWLFPDAATFGTANSFDISDAIVINEIMYRAYPDRGSPGTPAEYDTTVLVDMEATGWRYSRHEILAAQTPYDPGANWDDTAHTVDGVDWFGPGQAPLAYETGTLPIGINTTFTDPVTNDPYITAYYFEQDFDLTQQQIDDFDSLTLQHLVDDGAVFYINGQEMLRFNMNAGPVDFTTLSNGGPTDASYSGIEVLPIDPADLVVGTNRLSVEVHQASTASSDVTFAAELSLRELVSPGTPGTGYTESDEEWIELFNRGASAVNLTGWSLGGGIDYVFPFGTTIDAGGYLVVARDAADMLLRYPGLDVVGNFGGRLANGDEQVVLLDAAANPADELRYADRGKWPRLADGRGSSLELRDPDANNALPSAWAASDETDQSAWQTITYTGTAENDGIGTSLFHEFVLGLLNEGELLLDNVSVIEDPGGAATQLIQNGDFQADAIGVTPAHWVLVGTHGSHGRSVVAEDPDNAANRVLRVVATGATEDKSNQISTAYVPGQQVEVGTTYEISFDVRWLGGSNQVNTRLYFNDLQRTTHIDVPTDTGTPGAANSQALAGNIGPTYQQLAHAPVVPATGQNVTVSLRADDGDGVAAMTLHYNVDGAGWLTAPMTDQGDGLWAGTIPGQATGGVTVQFYAEGQDGLGAVSTWPADGAGSRAMFEVQDGRANLATLHNVRIVMTDADIDWLYDDAHFKSNRMSNDRLGATVIYNEQEVFYDAGVRLKGSGWGRNSGSATGFNIEFPADHKFRGVHDTISIERGGVQKEILSKHMINAAGGGLASLYDDMAYIVTPRDGDTGIGLLAMARYGDVYLDSQYVNGSEGAQFNMELLYTPNATIDGHPDSVKRFNPYTHANGSFDLQNLGDDKEAYRWNFQLRNNRGVDDFQAMIDVAQALELTGAELDARTQEVMDVDQWMRTFAMESLVGNDDFYTRIWNHNFRMVVRPEDGRMLALPWDLDRAFQLSTNASLWGVRNLQKVIELPTNQRLYYGHLWDIINTTANTDYMGYWTTHYGNLAGGNFSGTLSYIGARSAFVLSQLPAEIPFEITTGGGGSINVDQPQAVIEGQGWIDVREIRLAGNNDPLPVTWLDGDTWQTIVPIEFGENTITLRAYDHQGVQVGSDTIIVNGSAHRTLHEQLRVTELMFHPADPATTGPEAAFGDDDDFEFIELLNTGPETLDLEGVQLVDGIQFQFVTGAITTLAAGEYVLVARNPAALEARYGAGLPIAGQYSGKLSNGGEAIAVIDELGQTIQQIDFNDGWYSLADGLGFSLRVRPDALTDVDAWTDDDTLTISSQVGGSPGAADPEATWPIDAIVINEALTHTVAAEGDWIELHNTTLDPIDVSGWYLSDSDDPDELAKYVIQPGSVIPGGGYLVLNQRDHFGDLPVDGVLNPGSTIPFGLSEHGELVTLAAADGIGPLGYQATQRFDAADPEVTFGRHTDSTGDVDFVAMSAATQDGANAAPAVGTIVINEIMYHPVEGGDEFIELYNRSGATVPLYDPLSPDHTWRLDDGIDFRFPAGVEMAAGEYLLLVPGDPETFRAAHGIDAGVQIFGSYMGALSNGGERVQLAKPGEVDDNLSFSYIRVEHVRFDDTDPWPTAPDGNGPSLQRVEVTTYADDVANWFSGPSGGTPGAENTLPDTTPPTAPTDLTGTFVGGRSVQLDWTAATDAESGVALYRVYRDGLPVATSTTTTAVDTNVPAGAASQLYVTAVNGDGLEGPRSATIQAALWQAGTSDGGSYAGSDDASILEGDVDANSGGVTPVVLTPDFPSEETNHAVALLRWDVAAMPADAALQSASLTVEIDGIYAIPFDVYEMRRAWVESEVTWNEYAAGSAWQTAGAAGVDDRGTTLLGSATPEDNGEFTLTLNADGLALAQAWIDAPSGNQGLILLPSGDGVPSETPLGVPLVAFYDFDGDAGDDSGNGHDGTPSSVTFTSGAGGFEGEALSLSGTTTSFVDLPINLGTGAAPRMTWGAWVRPSVLGTTNREILSTDNGGFDRVLTIDHRNGTAGGNPLHFSAFAGTGVLRSSASTLPQLDQWRFVAATYDESAQQVQLFVEQDGALVKNTSATAIGASNAFVRVGMHANGVNEPFGGLVDNVFIFDDVLTDEQLADVFAGGAAAIVELDQQFDDRADRAHATYQQQVFDEPSLISYYTFDNDTTASITDEAPDNPHDGTAVGTIELGSGAQGVGQSLLLDGNGHVDLGTVADFQFSDGTGTVEAWIRPGWTAAGTNPAWFAVREGGATRHSLHVHDDRNQLAQYNGSSVLWRGAAIGNEWHHVVYTVDATGRKFFVDGQFIGGDSAGMGTTGLPAWIGATSTGGAERWIGGIDELAIYDDALDPATIFNHARSRDIEQTWDFETGTMAGWTAVPSGFADDVVFQQAGNQPVQPTGYDLSTIQGSHIVRTWQLNISGNRDIYTGIAQTDPFLLGNDAAFDFLIGGGAHAFYGDPDSPQANIAALTLEHEVGVNDWEVLFSATGSNANALTPGAWDASAYAGETVRLRIYDTHTGGWGHIDVDNIVYSTSAPGELFAATMELASSEAAEPSDRPQLGLVYTLPAEVVQQSVFYAGSALDDGGDRDAAIAADKSPLLPGQPATPANVTSYAEGLNGIAIDVQRLARPDLLTAADFALRTGSTSDTVSWQPVAAAPDVSIQLRGGLDDADRILLHWTADAVTNAWLEVTLLTTAATGLTSPEVFYFGNAVGDTGNDAGNLLVTAADVIAVRDNPRGSGNRADATNPFDFNRDRLVDATDALLARNHVTSPFTAVRLIDLTPVVPPPPAEGEAIGPVVGHVSNVPDAASIPAPRNSIPAIHRPTTRPAARPPAHPTAESTDQALAALDETLLAPII